MIIKQLRKDYHQQILKEIIRVSKGYPNFADGSSKASRGIAWGIIDRLGYSHQIHDSMEDQVLEQTAGDRFETYTAQFLEQAFSYMVQFRPGNFYYSTLQTEISRFDQYEHLADLQRAIIKDKNLASSLGGDYIVRPDIIIARTPVTDEELNQVYPIVESLGDVSRLTPLRQANRQNPKLILHASISCKWTIRSDRSQNTRTEALNLIRNRKGNLPHITAVTAEPLPTRIAALALGTGDLDCVYHFALYELEDSIKDIDNEDQLDMLKMLVEGRRLRDISDLPFDLAI